MTTSPSSPKERVETSARRLVSPGSDVARARGGWGHRAIGASTAVHAATSAIAERGSSERACGVCAPSESSVEKMDDSRESRAFR